MICLVFLCSKHISTYHFSHADGQSVGLIELSRNGKVRRTNPIHQSRDIDIHKHGNQNMN